MKANEQTIQEIKRAISKIARKFPPSDEALPMTDIFLQIRQESGDFMALNDDDDELNRCVIEEWIGNTQESFYNDVQPILQRCLEEMRPTLMQMGIMKPFTFTLVDDDRETIAELYLVDDDMFMIDGELMKGLKQDLNAFLDRLMKE